MSSKYAKEEEISGGKMQSSTDHPPFFDSINSDMFGMTAESGMAIASFESPRRGFDDSPYVDFLDGSNLNFNFGDAREDDDMIGDLPGADELHDKRKSLQDINEDNAHDGKRREGEDKSTAKKPGRKPLTSEPTTKRKAQNRAAQRAFRDRKEQHLKDLETKVGELEKASESANHENGLLKAQVDRLQVELREYRKRVALNNGSKPNRSPAVTTRLPFLQSQADGTSGNTFHFEFPRFGSLPSTVFNSDATPQPFNPLFATTTTTSTSVSSPGALARNDSAGHNISPGSKSRVNSSISSATSLSPPVFNPVGATNASPPLINNQEAMANIFNATLGRLGSASSPTNYIGFLPTTTAEPGKINSDLRSQNAHPSQNFQFKSVSFSSESPDSSSSVSQYGGPFSSCGTSPEPSQNSPNLGNKDASLASSNGGNVTGETPFGDQLNMAYANMRNPVHRTNSKSDENSVGVAVLPNSAPLAPTSSVFDDPLKDFDWFASQNGGQFDPQLFGDYREPQNAIVGDGDFTGGFFNDAMPTVDIASPFNWADLTAPTGLTPMNQRQNPLEQADALQAGMDPAEEVAGSGNNPDEQLSCHMIWDKLQGCDDFKDGSLDIDALCSELKAKACCSESGVVVDRKAVEDALRRRPASGSDRKLGLTM